MVKGPAAPGDDHVAHAEDGLQARPGSGQPSRSVVMLPVALPLKVSVKVVPCPVIGQGLHFD